jgi:hypothetical protein
LGGGGFADAAFAVNSHFSHNQFIVRFSASGFCHQLDNSLCKPDANAETMMKPIQKN